MASTIKGLIPGGLHFESRRESFAIFTQEVIQILPGRPSVEHWACHSGRGRKKSEVTRFLHQSDVDPSNNAAQWSCKGKDLERF